MADPILKNKKVQAEIKRIKDEHAVKTKALMKSINKLKDDLEKEKYSNQDNVRAKIIERMKKDISDNETVIEMMRSMINDDEAINKEIVKVLSKGPLRARVLSREELRMEIKKLNSEIASLKAGGATKKLKKKKSSNESEDQALEESFDNMTLDRYRDLKSTIEGLKAEIDTKQQELDKARAEIEDLRDDKKTAGLSLHTLTEKVQNMDADQQALAKIKLKLKEMKRAGMFSDSEFDTEEEGLLKLLDKLKDDFDQKDMQTKTLQGLVSKLQQEKNNDMDDLVDEYNMKDEECQSLADKYNTLRREVNKYKHDLTKYKQELIDAQEKAAEVKEKYAGKLKEKTELVAKYEEELEHKEKRIVELQNELDAQLQHTPNNSDTSTEFDSYSLQKERKKVAKLVEEISRLYDIIDKLKLKNEAASMKNREQSLEKVREKSLERAKNK